MMETEMASEQSLREVFELIDADGSGNLDRDEVVTLIDFFSDKPMSDAQVDEAMRSMDDDGSGACFGVCKHVVEVREHTLTSSKSAVQLQPFSAVVACVPSNVFSSWSC